MPLRGSSSSGTVPSLPFPSPLPLPLSPFPSLTHPPLSLARSFALSREDGQPLSKKALKKLEQQKKKDALKAEKAAKLVTSRAHARTHARTRVKARAHESAVLHAAIPRL